MFAQIEAAASRLDGVANKTPVLTSASLDKKLKSSVFFKCENFQRVGAFKFRGAYNSLIQLSEQQKKQGVIAYSSGNHAQAVACVGQMLGIATTIVMPQDAPAVKLAATKSYGAKIITYDASCEKREVVAQKILSHTPLTLIPPFDHPNIIAGQGTLGLEFILSCPRLDVVLVPCGGGGLLSGVAVAVKQLRPDCRVIGVEPENADDATRSFYSGKLVTQPNPDTIADGTRTASLGELTFPLIRQNVDQMVTVSEAAIKQAVRFFFYRMKIVVEPSGALGLAALLSQRLKAEGRLGVVISGGNIDGATMSEILSN